MNARVIRKTVICLASRFHNVFLDRAKNGAKAFFGRQEYVSAKRKLATQARWGGVGKPSLRSCKEEFREKNPASKQQQQNQCRDIVAC